MPLGPSTSIADDSEKLDCGNFLEGLTPFEQVDNDSTKDASCNVQAGQSTI